MPFEVKTIEGSPVSSSELKTKHLNRKGQPHLCPGVLYGARIPELLFHLKESQGLKMPSNPVVEGRSPEGSDCMYDGMNIVGLPNRKIADAEPYVREIQIKHPETNKPILTIRVKQEILQLVRKMRGGEMTGEQIAEELIKKPISDFYEYEAH